jgi:hypothetical protein
MTEVLFNWEESLKKLIDSKKSICLFSKKNGGKSKALEFILLETIKSSIHKDIDILYVRRDSKSVVDTFRSIKGNLYYVFGPVVNEFTDFKIKIGGVTICFLDVNDLNKSSKIHNFWYSYIFIDDADEVVPLLNDSARGIVIDYITPAYFLSVTSDKVEDQICPCFWEDGEGFLSAKSFPSAGNCIMSVCLKSYTDEKDFTAEPTVEIQKE